MAATQLGARASAPSCVPSDEPKEPPGSPAFASIAPFNLSAAPEPTVDPGPDHRDFRDDEFWRVVPGFHDVDRATFEDPIWQARASVTSVASLARTLGPLARPELLHDVDGALRAAPMSIRLSPYLLSLMDWSNPAQDPLRRQFLPLASERRPDHPMAELDSLHEQEDSPVPGIVHRYPDKVLFLALTNCPVYCRFCTRSYAVGLDTGAVEKAHISARPAAWRAAFEYIAAHPRIEDVVVSGGDVWQLRAGGIRRIGEALLEIPHIRRVRFASKGLAVLPMKITGDSAWTDALCDVVDLGRRLGKSVVVHTHIAHPDEITAHTERSALELFRRGVVVRNQCVVMRGVNDDADTMRRLVRRLGWMQIQPYYVYQHDFLPGVEDLRTSVRETVALEKQVRGATAGFHTPTFIVDLPGGGGKRDVHSFEHYDRVTGISVYTSPNIQGEARYLYYDPIDSLPPEGRARWADPRQHRVMASDALASALRAAAVAPEGG